MNGAVCCVLFAVCCLLRLDVAKVTRGGGTNLDTPTWERRTEELLQHVPLAKTSLAAMHKLVDLIATYEASEISMLPV